MIFKFLISIVFIAELIIAFAVFNKLYKINKDIIFLNNFLENSKNDLREILILTKKISAQIFTLSRNYVNKFREQNEINLLNKINNIVLSLLLWKLNHKIIKKIRRNKTFKMLSKGFMLVQNMI